MAFLFNTNIFLEILLNQELIDEAFLKWRLKMKEKK